MRLEFEFSYKWYKFYLLNHSIFFCLFYSSTSGFFRNIAAQKKTNLQMCCNMFRRFFGLFRHGLFLIQGVPKVRSCASCASQGLKPCPKGSFLYFISLQCITTGLNKQIFCPKVALSFILLIFHNFCAIFWLDIFDFCFFSTKLGVRVYVFPPHIIFVALISSDYFESLLLPQ